MKGCTVNHDVCRNSLLSLKSYIAGIAVQGLNTTTFHVLLYNFTMEVIIDQHMQFFVNVSKKKRDICDIYFHDFSLTSLRRISG